jgi:hypothetical protein
MIKLTKDKLKQLIKEEIASPNRNIQGGKVFAPTLGAEYIRNYKNGEPPNNQNADQAYAREPYETGPKETHIKEGEVYVTQGKNQFQLVFHNEELTSGCIYPIGEYKFNIVNGMIEWNQSAPANVRNDADLEQQIMDYSGREK